MERTNGYIRPRGYYDNKGTLLTADFQKINGILYGSAIMKYAMGSIVASNGMIMSHGLTSALYCVVSPQTGGVITGGHVFGSSITFYIQANAGIFFQTTSATVNWIVFGN